jgi:transcriptional regulator EpsA
MHSISMRTTSAQDPPLSHRQQAGLLSAIASGLRVAGPREFFRWTQEQVQAVLPHQVLVCLQFGSGGTLVRVECVHDGLLAPHVRQALAARHDGLAVRLARHCLDRGGLPALDLGDSEHFRGALGRTGMDNVLLHGTGPTAQGTSVFALFGLPEAPDAHAAHMLELLLPCLHLALSRLPLAPAAPTLVRPLSEREVEIVGWLREGKSNQEMGRLLGISALTVKNHLQRIYRALGVGNRAHALARCMEWQLIGE